MKAERIWILLVLMVALVVLAVMFSGAMAKEPPRVWRAPTAAITSGQLEDNSTLRFTVAINLPTSLSDLRVGLRFGEGSSAPSVLLDSSGSTIWAGSEGPLVLEMSDLDSDGKMDSGDGILVKNENGALREGTYIFIVIFDPTGEIVCQRSVSVT